MTARHLIALCEISLGYVSISTTIGTFQDLKRAGLIDYEDPIYFGDVPKLTQLGQTILNRLESELSDLS